jgi:two-component system sensor histidine kinase DesK
MEAEVSAMATRGLDSRLVATGLGLRSPGTGSPWRWFFSAIWLVYLIQPVSSLFGRGHGVLWTAGGLAIVAAFGVIYIWTLLVAVNRGGTSARTGLVAITVLAVLSCTIYGKEWTPLWMYVSAACGMVLTAGPGGRRVALRAVLAVTAAYIFFGWLTHDDAADFLVVALPVLLIGLAMIGFRLQMQLMGELAQARETVAKLAANDERLRLARDMHDLTGQSLSTITLKAELAAA